MKKSLKWLGGLALVGTAAGLITAYFCKQKDSDEDWDDELDFAEDEDFDLDSDLKPIDREYVSLNKTASEKENISEETPAAESKEDAPAEESKEETTSEESSKAEESLEAE